MNGVIPVGCPARPVSAKSRTASHEGRFNPRALSVSLVKAGLRSSMAALVVIGWGFAVKERAPRPRTGAAGCWRSERQPVLMRAAPAAIRGAARSEIRRSSAVAPRLPKLTAALAAHLPNITQGNCLARQFGTDGAAEKPLLMKEPYLAHVARIVAQ